MTTNKVASAAKETDTKLNKIWNTERGDRNIQYTSGPTTLERTTPELTTTAISSQNPITGRTTGSKIHKHSSSRHKYTSITLRIQVHGHF